MSKKVTFHAVVTAAYPSSVYVKLRTEQGYVMDEVNNKPASYYIPTSKADECYQNDVVSVDLECDEQGLPVLDTRTASTARKPRWGASNFKIMTPSETKVEVKEEAAVEKIEEDPFNPSLKKVK